MIQIGARHLSGLIRHLSGKKFPLKCKTLQVKNPLKCRAPSRYLTFQIHTQCSVYDLSKVIVYYLHTRCDNIIADDNYYCLPKRSVFIVLEILDKSFIKMMSSLKT